MNEITGPPDPIGPPPPVIPPPTDPVPPPQPEPVPEPEPEPAPAPAPAPAGPAFLIEKAGERQCVIDIDGYEGWAVIAFGDEAVPIEDAEFDGERWTVPLAVLKRRAKDAIAGAALAQLRRGYSPPEGPLAGETLQLRDEDDKSNWLTSQGTYTALVAAGMGDVVGANFRTASNRVVTMTYSQGLNELLNMAGWGAGILSASWALKDAIEAAATPEEIEAVSWPG